MVTVKEANSKLGKLLELGPYKRRVILKNKPTSLLDNWRGKEAEVGYAEIRFCYPFNDFCHDPLIEKTARQAIERLGFAYINENCERGKRFSVRINGDRPDFFKEVERYSAMLEGKISEIIVAAYEVVDADTHEAQKRLFDQVMRNL